MPTTAVRSDPALWDQIRLKWLKSAKGGVAGKWNARKAMLAVQEYKRLGGRYLGARARNNSLKKWEREDWGYVDGDPSGRYLPAAVRAALSPAEKRKEKALKKGHPGEWIPYSPSVNAKMRQAGIYKVAKKSAAKKPATKKTAAKKPAAKPSTKKLATKPTTKKLATEPATKKLATKKPTTKKAATMKAGKKN